MISKFYLKKSIVFFPVKTLLRMGRSTKVPKVRKKKLMMFLITITSILSLLFFISSGEDLDFVELKTEEQFSQLNQIPEPYLRREIIEKSYKGNFIRKLNCFIYLKAFAMSQLLLIKETQNLQFFNSKPKSQFKLKCKEDFSLSLFFTMSVAVGRCYETL